MKAMILAAGLGTRLRPLTNDLPKTLLPINRRPLIEYALLLLQRYQVTDVIINLHHQGQKIMDMLKTGSRWGLKISYSYEPVILGTGGGLKKVQPLFADGTFLVINGDILVDINLDQVVEFHRSKKAIATLVLREDRDVEAWGAVEIDSRDQIRRIRGCPPWSGEALMKRMFAGIHVMDPEVFRYMPDEGCFDIMDAYLKMIQQDERVMGYTFNGYWMDIGSSERYRRAQGDMQRGNIKLSYLTRVRG